MAEDQLKPTAAKRYRSNRTYLHKASDELVVRIRRLDITTMVLQNLVPFSLLKAANQFEEMVRKLGNIGTGDALDTSDAALKELESINPSQLTNMMDFLRHYAVTVVAEPVITEKEDGNEEHISVTDLSGDELLSIFYARPSQEKEEQKPTVLTVEQAEEFRRPEPAAISPASQDGPEVRPEAQLVDTPEREFVYG